MNRFRELNPFEQSELLVALDHRLHEDHAYVWREDAIKMHDELADLLGEEHWDEKWWEASK